MSNLNKEHSRAHPKGCNAAGHTVASPDSPKEYNVEDYLGKIKNAETLDELDFIIECAAFDENLTNSEYCELYAIAMKQSQNL